jgi:hypothetical protein
VELNLSGDQLQRVSDVLRRVNAMEDELFSDFRRHQQERVASARTRSEQRMEKLDEAHQHLARASQEILEQLTPAQRQQLQVLCRQAATDEAGFQARMNPGQAGRGRGGGFGGGGGSIGGGGGTTTPGTGANSGTGSYGGGGPANGQASISSGQVGGGGAYGGGARGGGGGSTTPGSGATWRNEHGNEYKSGGGPGGVVRVISFNRVQEHLGLSAEQRLKIAEITAQISQMEASLFAPPKAPRQASGQEWYEQRRLKEESARQAVSRSGEEILQQLTPGQQTRLKEICLQAQGTDALFKPEIIRVLNLTATQQMKLASMRQESERQAAKILIPDLSGKPQSLSATYQGTADERVRALQRDTEVRMISSVLTPVQQSKLQQMKGKAFAGIDRFMPRTTVMSNADASAGGTPDSGRPTRTP